MANLYLVPPRRLLGNRSQATYYRFITPGPLLNGDADLGA